MAGLENERELLTRAVAGDIAATQCLLLRYDDALRDALAVLNPEQLAAVQLSLENKTTAQSAAEMNKFPGAIRMLLKRAKERLREELGNTDLWFSKK